MAHHVRLAAIVLAGTAATAAPAAVVLNMPAAPAAAAALEEPTTYERENGRSADDLGATALWRFARVREVREPAIDGWHDVAYAWRWPGYRVSVSPFHFHRRVWFGGCAWPGWIWH